MTIRGRSNRRDGQREALLTVPDVAHHCLVAERTVRRWIASGDLAVVRFGRLVRVRPKDLDVFIRDHLS